MEFAPNAHYQIVDKVGMPHVIDFVIYKLRDYDTTWLEWIKLLPLNRQNLLHGACDFPYQSDVISGVWDRGYRIRASVNIDKIPPFTFTHWGRTPSERNPRGWVSGEHKYRFEDLDECAVHTLSHECFHFLADSKQITEKNIEANANWWADTWLTEFQRTLES